MLVLIWRFSEVVGEWKILIERSGEKLILKALLMMHQVEDKGGTLQDL